MKKQMENKNKMQPEITLKELLDKFAIIHNTKLFPNVKYSAFECISHSGVVNTLDKYLSQGLYTILIRSMLHTICIFLVPGVVPH